MQSVEATIAKAQATEQFHSKILPSLGLSNDLASLAEYANDVANDNAGKEEGDSDLAEVDDDEIEAVSTYMAGHVTIVVYTITDVAQP